MYRSAKQVGSLLVATLFVSFLSLFTSGPALAHTTATKPAAISANVQTTAITKSLSYWTADRMKAALPGDKLLAGAKLTHVASSTHSTASGSRAPIAPTRATSLNAAQLPKATITNAYQLPQYDYQYFPYSTIGKVFFTDFRTGYNYVCSGTAVNSNNKSVVDTAGHCVNQGSGSGNWYGNWVFCPQYYYGGAPFGCWGARQLWTSGEWYYNGSLEDDFGEAVMAPNGYGYLVNVVGGTGWAYGQSAYQYFYAFGYPAAYPFNGNSIFYCPGSGTPYGFDDGYVVSIPCNMTGGSSGGGWLISIGNTFGYVNGHNDFKYTNDPNHMYSPYYDSGWYAVFNAAQNS